MTARFQGTCQERGHIPAFPRHPNIKFDLQATPNHGQPCSIAGVFSEDPKKLNLIIQGWWKKVWETRTPKYGSLQIPVVLSEQQSRTKTSARTSIPRKSKHQI